MCLNQLKKFKVPVYGYKIFRVSCDGSLRSLFQGKPRPYSVGRVLDERCFSTRSDIELKIIYDYPYGFHIYQSLKSAKKKLCSLSKYKHCKYEHYAIYKVEIIEPHTTGTELLGNAYCHVIVSKKIRIIEKIC